MGGTVVRAGDRGLPPRAQALSARWLAESTCEGELVARVGRDGDRLLAEWPGRARLSVKADGTDLDFAGLPGADPAEVDKLRRGSARLLLAHLAGSIPLHGSAVAIDGRAVVFVGSTRLGKSTLAAAMCELAGASLLGDDAVAIERRGDGYAVIGLEERHWLDAPAAGALGRPNDFAAEKAPLVPRRADLASAPLALIAHLEFVDEGEPRLVPVRGLDAVTGLLAQLTRFVVDDPELARRDLGSLADLVEKVAIARLVRPRRFDLLPATAQLVAEAVSSAATSKEQS